MKISNSNNSNWISLTRIEKENEYIPCVCVALEIKSVLSVSFDATEHLWVADWQIKKFITDLQELHAKGNGTAVLETSGHGEFHCTIFNTDNSGHLYITLKLSNCSNTDEYYKLETGFEIDPGNMYLIIDGLRGLIEEN